MRPRLRLPPSIGSATARLALASCALAAIGSHPARAADTDAYATAGPWTVGHYDGVPSAPCIAMNTTDEHGSILVAMVGELGVTAFALVSSRLSLTPGANVAAEFLVDGRPFALRRTTATDANSIVFEGMSPGRTEGGLLRGVEKGLKLVVQAEGVRAVFDLKASKAAMELLNQCVMGASPPAGVSSASPPSSASSPSSSTLGATSMTGEPLSAEEEAEIALEVEGDQADASHRADDATDGVDRADTPARSSDALGRAMERFGGEGAAPAAQFQCEITGRDMLGLPDVSGRDRSTDVTLTIAVDGRALVNGTTLHPVQSKRSGATIETAIYSSREVLDAVSGAPMQRAPVVGLTPHQMEAFRAFQQMGRDMADLAMGGVERFMVVGIATGVVGFFDLDASGEPVNQTTPVCLKTR